MLVSRPPWNRHVRLQPADYRGRITDHGFCELTEQVWLNVRLHCGPVVHIDWTPRPGFTAADELAELEYLCLPRSALTRTYDLYDLIGREVIVRCSADAEGHLEFKVAPTENGPRTQAPAASPRGTV